MTASARSIYLGILVLLCGTGCSLWESSKDLVFEEPPPEEPTTPVSFGAQSIQDRYPFVRFLKRADRSITGVVTVPAGAGDQFVARLKELCTMDDGAEPPPPGPAAEGVAASPKAHNPKLYVETGGGGVYRASALAKPWEPTAGKWEALEDLIFITGSEDEVIEVLEALDLWYNASPQIEIKAVIMDVTNNDLFERGIIQADGQPILENVQGNTFIRGLGGAFPSASNPGYGGGKGPAGLGGVFRVGFIDSNFQLDAYLQFLEQEGVIDLVAQPTVVVRNGVPALLASTEEVPYLKPGGAFSIGGALTYNVEYRPIGVTLNVIPFLVGHDTLHLVIQADASRIGREFIVGLDSNNNTISVPSTSKRSATTEVLVRSGQRVVIGGLRLTETRQQRSKIPILGDIPILGWLFSNEYEEKTTTDIYFVIEPTVKRTPTIEKIGDIFDPFAQ